MHGATSARRSRGIAASRESTTTGRRPICEPSRTTRPLRAPGVLSRGASHPSPRRQIAPLVKFSQLILDIGYAYRPSSSADRYRASNAASASSMRAASVIPDRTMRALANSSGSTVVLRRMRFMPSLWHFRVITNGHIRGPRPRGRARHRRVHRRLLGGDDRVRAAGSLTCSEELRRQCGDRGPAGCVRRGLLGKEHRGDQRRERETHGHDEHHRVGV